MHGFTLTEMVVAISDEIQANLRADVPVERFANVSEIAGLVRCPASREPDYITNEVIDIGGGLELWRTPSDPHFAERYSSKDDQTWTAGEYTRDQFIAV
ncbi:prepilin-type N-terminal cleavage/methylation domain-containing protein [Natrinema amylolyticum]|uniref:prepilin-type N-terminal cleavage/methylation domain-containing protein n=1 Tax=Natrinema amylolyticum TaxID=2878679 RepID=UPI00299CF79E|nr:prepilin-type N-terminal cleavage/methylation domain-containing protein [Natrinema amylolyticum]